MKKEDYIVYDYESRSGELTDCVRKALDYTYEISYPKPEKSFTEMCKDIAEKQKAEGKEHDVNYRITYCDKYHWPTDFFYIPQNVLETVWNNRKEAAGAELHWDDDMEALIHFLFEKPGIKEVYKPMYEGGEPVRHHEDMPLIKDIIGDEAAAKLKDVLETYRATYKWGLREANIFAWGYLSTPHVNRDTVINAWKEAFGVDIVIPDDSAWVDVYEIEDFELEDEED